VWKLGLSQSKTQDIDMTFETEAVEENIWTYKTGHRMGEN
jgi:hypothetical protein